MIITDSGFGFGLFDRRDTYHPACCAFLNQCNESLIITFHYLSRAVGCADARRRINRERCASLRSAHPTALADEPTGNLDSKSGMEIIELLESLNRQGVTLMIITHDQTVGNRAQRQIRIVDGQIAT